MTAAPEGLRRALIQALARLLLADLERRPPDDPSQRGVTPRETTMQSSDGPTP